MAFGGSLFSIFGRTEKGMEDKSPLADAWKRVQGYGDESYGYGRGLTDEGLGGLRDLRKTYAERANDPLGPYGRNIFARARGNLTDSFTRTVNSGTARRKQLAVQSGGGLTPEQIDAANAEDRRAANEGLFRGENELAIGESTLALSEASKFFDRMEGIDRTIAGVGQDERARGLATILAAISGRQDRINKIVGHVLGPWG